MYGRMYQEQSETYRVKTCLEECTNSSLEVMLIALLPIRPIAHPLYCPSHLLQLLTYDSCRSDGHIFLPIRPIFSSLFCHAYSAVAGRNN